MPISDVLFDQLILDVPGLALKLKNMGDDRSLLVSEMTACINTLPPPPGWFFVEDPIIVCVVGMNAHALQAAQRK